MLNLLVNISYIDIVFNICKQLMQQKKYFKLQEFVVFGKEITKMPLIFAIIEQRELIERKKHEEYFWQYVNIKRYLNYKLGTYDILYWLMQLKSRAIQTYTPSSKTNNDRRQDTKID